MCLVILFNSRAVSGSTPLSATITIIQLKTIKSEVQKSLSTWLNFFLLQKGIVLVKNHVAIHSAALYYWEAVTQIFATKPDKISISQKVLKYVP